MLGGEGSYVRMHAVLNAQHVHWTPCLLEPLKQAALEQKVSPSLTQHSCRQLLGVSHKYDPANPSVTSMNPDSCKNDFANQCSTAIGISEVAIMPAAQNNFPNIFERKIEMA